MNSESVSDVSPQQDGFIGIQAQTAGTHPYHVVKAARKLLVNAVNSADWRGDADLARSSAYWWWWNGEQ